MHAGPPQSGHGCPECQVCDLPTLVLFSLRLGCQFGEGHKINYPGCFLTNWKHVDTSQLGQFHFFPSPWDNCAFSLSPSIVMLIPSSLGWVSLHCILEAINPSILTSHHLFNLTHINVESPVLTSNPNNYCFPQWWSDFCPNHCNLKPWHWTWHPLVCPCFVIKLPQKCPTSCPDIVLYPVMPCRIQYTHIILLSSPYSFHCFSNIK